VVRSPAITRISCHEAVTSTELAVTWTVPVMSEYSGRAAVFREELQSCRRTDPAILEERQPVKVQCEDSASVVVNCKELKSVYTVIVCNCV
jgi:hypothetical protein